MITLAFANRCILFAMCDTTHDGEHQNISIETYEPSHQCEHLKIVGGGRKRAANEESAQGNPALSPLSLRILLSKDERHEANAAAPQAVGTDAAGRFAATSGACGSSPATGGIDTFSRPSGTNPAVLAAPDET